MKPYGRQLVDDDDVESVVSVLRSEYITQGQKVEEFGAAIAQYCGADYAIAVSSGTAALELAIKSLEIGPGDEVITTPITFCATANAVMNNGSDIRLVDIEESTLNINPELLEAAITEHTKAILPVDFRGHPASLPEISRIATKYGLYIIQDASHSLGSAYYHQGARYQCGDGRHSDITTFSFHPVKHITSGEGGAVVTNDTVIAEKVRVLRSHGVVKGNMMQSISDRRGEWYYDVEKLGSNYRITDIQAALGLSQLNKIDEFKKRRRVIVEYYNEELKDLVELILPYEKENVDSNFHIYVIQIRENVRFDRYDVFKLLQEYQYKPMVHYIPLHYLSYYKKRYGFQQGDYPVAENYYNRAITIPLFPSLTDEDIEKVVCDIKRIIEKLSAI